MSVPADIDVRDIKTYDYDVFVFLGGEGASIHFDEQRVRKLVQDVQWKTIGATGEAPVILALADAASGKSHRLVPFRWPIECARCYLNQPASGSG